ncbi:MAG TPA: AAA family ATPase, partial [Nitrospira sp.]|nr:AAA family ATPase [Nitrospira sp.]
RGITDYPPSIAWESSPGRFQALWLAASGDFQGASWPGNENQRLTYHLEADRSGWDTTQLLRFPGLENHKPAYKKDGKFPRGKILWSDGPQYHPGDFSELPAVNGLAGGNITDALELEIESIDRHKVLARVKLRLTRRIRELLSARAASGDRSDALWEMERGLADAGCSVAEIVAIVRETVWNKYTDRADEMRRLILEASKAIAAKPEAKEDEEPEEIERSAPQRFGALLLNVKRPKFLVEGVWTEGACGFVAGEPKCYKSWIALDFALSVATGASFLGEFRVPNPGPVLYIQEEDPLPTLKTRTAKIWVGKGTDKLKLIATESFPEVEWLPPEKEQEFDPDIHAYVQKGVTLSDEAWQLWLDEVIGDGMDGEPYRLITMDTLMMMAGDVEENKSQAMTTQIFRPLKVLARKHDVALQVVHHMGKS